MQTHVEQILAVDRLLSIVVWNVVTNARVLESQLMHTCCTELEKVRHVYLLDVTIEDELQTRSKTTEGQPRCATRLTFLRPLSNCCMNMAVHSFSGGR